MLDPKHPLKGRKPDPIESVRFLQLLTGERKPVCCFQVFCDAEKRDDLAQTFHDTFKGGWKRLARAQINGCGVYVTVNGTDEKGRKAKNIRTIRAAFVDFDGAQLPDEWKIKPHIINETSSGRYHAFWLLNPSQDFESWRALQAQLAARFGGDPLMTDLSRVVRVPGFFHLKSTTPFRSHIVEAVTLEEVPVDGFSRYSIAELSAAYPAEFNAPLAPREGDRIEEPEGGFDNDTDIARAIQYLKEDAPLSVEGEQGDKTAYLVAAHLRELAISRDLAVELMSEHWNSRNLPPWSQEELGVKVRNAYRYAQNDAGERSTTNDFKEDVPEVESTGTAVSTLRRNLTINRQHVAVDDIKNALRAIYKSGLLPAFDEFRQRFVFQAAKLPWDDAYGRELTDHNLRLVRMYLIERFQGQDFQPSKENVFEALKTIAYARKYDPVKDYLAAAQTKWDGTPRVASLFGKYFNCGDTEYTRGVSLAFAVGAVKRVRSPGSKFDTMPILKSAQGWNKSTAIKTLFGAEFFSDAHLGDLRSKDATMLIRGVWGLELPELEGMKRAEATTLKAFLSRAVDTVRDPYDKVVSHVPRRGVFIGTANEGGYLTDATGGRRFWPLTLKAPVDIAAIIADRSELWGEAATLEAQGASDVLPVQLWKIAASHQQSETASDPWADELRAFLDSRMDDYAFGKRDCDAPPPNPGDKVHSRELFDALDINADRRTIGMAQRLRVVMESIGWKYRRGVRIGGSSLPGYIAPSE
jgi:predicted P-loop ATPase